jgi:hypothetical protein
MEGSVTLRYAYFEYRPAEYFEMVAALDRILLPERIGSEVELKKSVRKWVSEIFSFPI